MSEEHEEGWTQQGLTYEVKVAGDVHINLAEGATLIINAGEPVDPPPPDPPDGSGG